MPGKPNPSSVDIVSKVYDWLKNHAPDIDLERSLNFLAAGTPGTSNSLANVADLMAHPLPLPKTVSRKTAGPREYARPARAFAGQAINELVANRLPELIGGLAAISSMDAPYPYSAVTRTDRPIPDAVETYHSVSNAARRTLEDDKAAFPEVAEFGRMGGSLASEFIPSKRLSLIYDIGKAALKPDNFTDDQFDWVGRLPTNVGNAVFANRVGDYATEVLRDRLADAGPGWTRNIAGPAARTIVGAGKLAEEKGVESFHDIFSFDTDPAPAAPFAGAKPSPDGRVNREKLRALLDAKYGRATGP